MNARTATSSAAALPPAVAAAVWAHLPLAERVAVVPLVSREWLEASRGPYAPFQDAEWQVTSLAQLTGLLRWLGRRAHVLRRLRLTIRIRSWRRGGPGGAAGRFADRWRAAAAQLSAVLGAAASLEEFSLRVDACVWRQPQHGWLLLPPALSSLSRLELTSHRLALPAGLARLPSLQQLRLCGSIQPGAELHLPASLARLELAGAATLASAAALPAWPLALAAMPRGPPALALLPAPPEAEAYWWREDGPGLTLDDVGGMATAGAAASAAGRQEALECDSARLLRAWDPALAPHLRSLQVAGALAPEPAAAGWGLWALLGEFRRLTSLSLRLDAPPNTSVAALPMAPGAFPEGLRELSVESARDASYALPLGKYLGSLRRLSLGPAAALRLAPRLRHMHQLTHLAITDSLPGPIIGQSSQGPAASAKLASTTTDGPTGEQHPADVCAATEWRHASAALASALAGRPAFYHLTVPTAPCDTEAERAVHLAAELLSQLRPATIVQGAINYSKQPLQQTFCAPSCPRF